MSKEYYSAKYFREFQAGGFGLARHLSSPKLLKRHVLKLVAMVGILTVQDEFLLVLRLPILWYPQTQNCKTTISAYYWENCLYQATSPISSTFQLPTLSCYIVHSYIIRTRPHLCASILNVHKDAQPVDMHYMFQAKEERRNSELVMAYILANWLWVPWEQEHWI